MSKCVKFQFDFIIKSRMTSTEQHRPIRLRWKGFTVLLYTYRCAHLCCVCRHMHLSEVRAYTYILPFVAHSQLHGMTTGRHLHRAQLKTHALCTYALSTRSSHQPPSALVRARAHCQDMLRITTHAYISTRVLLLLHILSALLSAPAPPNATQ